MSNFKRYDETANYQPSSVVESGSHFHSVERQVKTPLLNALIAGFFAGAVLIIPCLAIWHVASLPWVLFVSIIFAAGWWIFEHWDLWQLTARIELATGRNLDEDPRVGNELMRHVKVVVPEIDDNTLQPTGQFIHATFENDAKVYAIIYAHKISNVNFSENAMLKAGVVTPGEWKRIVDEMIARKWVAWVNPEHPTLGYWIRPSGEAAFQHYLDNPPLSE